MAGLFALFIIFKLIVNVNRNKARTAFLQGYAAGTVDELWRVVERNASPVFTSFNVAAAILGRLLAKEMPDLAVPSVKIAFMEQWNNSAVMQRAQQLDRSIQLTDKDSALFGLRESIKELY